MAVVGQPRPVFTELRGGLQGHRVPARLGRKGRSPPFLRGSGRSSGGSGSSKLQSLPQPALAVSLSNCNCL